MNSNYGRKPTYQGNSNRTYNDRSKNQQGGAPKSSENPQIVELIERINRGGALHNTLTCEEINLPRKAAFNVGVAFKSKGNSTDDKTLNTNQLRKYFEQISNVRGLEVEKAKTELFKVLPQIAYAAGRKVCPKDFYKLMEACISPSTLKDEQDIDALIDFLTAVVAYTKFNSID